MNRKPRIRYSVENAIAWAAGIRLALDEERQLPLDFEIPDFSGRSGRPEAFSHWLEYAARTVRRAVPNSHWVEQFKANRYLETLEDEYSCLLSILRCVQQEKDGTAGQMTRDHLIAAEVFGYSFANYRDHLGIGNIRYEDMMPDDAKRLQLAVAENWPLAKVAKDQNVDTDIAASLIQSTKSAMDVVNASTPAESFRTSIKQLVQRASEKGLNTDQDIQHLVTQICYRVSDLSCLLDIDGKTLSDYCQAFREESGTVDDDDDPMDI